MLKRIVKVCISALFYGMDRTVSFIKFIIINQRPEENVVSLTYHGIKDCQREKFRAQMDMIGRFGGAGIEDTMKFEKGPKRRLKVTFDDGFKSVLKNGLAIMWDRGIAPIIFIPSGYIGKRPDWILNSEHINAQEEVLAKEDIEELSFDTVTIGSHCVTHKNLIELSETDALTELNESKKALEAIVHKQVCLVSLPYGGYNERIAELARKVGYKYVFLNVPVPKASSRGGSVIGRVDVSPEDWMFEFKLKVLGAYQWLPVGIMVKKKLKGLCRGNA